MDADDKRVNSMLARLDEFHEKIIRERKTLRSSLLDANAKIAELKTDVAQYKEKCKQSEIEKVTLTDIIEKLQSRLDGYFKDIDSASLPSVASVTSVENNTEEISSSNEVIENQRNSTDSANSPDNTPRRSSTGEQQNGPIVSALKRTVDNQDVGIPQQNQPQLETVSEFVCSTEIITGSTGTDGISNYFSNFYIDPQNIHSDETLAVSSVPIPPSIKMVLSSYNRFDKRYVVFVTDTTASKDCHFLSIDDLLALPENADLVQQLHVGQSTTPEGGQNLTLFTVLGQLIARMSPSIPKSVDAGNTVETPAIQAPIKKEENSNVVAGTKRGRPTIKKEDTKKRKPDLIWASKDDTGTSPVKLNSAPKKDHRIQCRVCELMDHKTNYFKSRAALDCHIIQAHPLNSFPIYFRCPCDEEDCIRHFLQEQGLRKHIQSCHPDANTSAVLESESKLKSWECTYCGDEFLSSRIYLKHMKDHHGGFAETTELMRSSKLLGRRKIIKTESFNESTENSNLRKRSNVSSFFDDDSDSDAISAPSTSRKEVHRRRSKSRKIKDCPEPEQTNVVVTEAEIHPEKVPTEHKEPTSSRNTPSSKSTDPIDVTRVNTQVNPLTSTGDPTDINEFVLSSVYEISSYIEKHNLATLHPSVNMDLPPIDSPTEKVYHTMTAPRTSDKSQSSQFSAIPSLPCLLDDCPGCDFHPKPPAISFTLDDEYVSSCREDILAELYSIPDNPPMVPGSFSTALYDSVQLDTNVGGKKVTNEPSSSINDRDIANIIIADDQCSPGIRDIANIFISDDVESSCTNNKNNWQSDQTDSDHPSLPDEEGRTNVDETIGTENKSSSVEDKNQNKPVTNEEQSVLKDDCSVETNTIENQSKTSNRLDANSVRQDSSPIRKDHFENNEAVIENQNKTANGLDDNPVCHDSSPIREDIENNETVIGNQIETVESLDNNPVCNNSSPICEDQSKINEAVTENQNEIFNGLDNDPVCPDSSPIPGDVENNETVIENQNETANGFDNNPVCDNSTPICEEQSKIDNSATERQNETVNNLDDNSICHDSSAISEAENNKTLSVDNDDCVYESNFDQNKITDEENQKEKTDIEYDTADESFIPNEISTSTKNAAKIDEKLPTNWSPRKPEVCDRSTVNEISENDMENHDTPTSALSTCQTNISVAEDQRKSPKSSIDDQISNDPTPETNSTTSDTSENCTATNNSISTNSVSIKKPYQKSIFDLDPDSNPATPNRDQIVDMEISTAPENESNQPINVENEISNGVDSSDIRETASVNGKNDLEPVKFVAVDDMSEETESDTNHDDNMPTIDLEEPHENQNMPNGTSSPKYPPVLEQMTDTIGISDPHSSPLNITPCDEENTETNPMNTSLNTSSLNQSTSSVNSTFYGEYGLSSVCEIEAIGEKTSIEASTPCSVSNQPSFPKRHEITPILRKLLSRPGSVRCTNEIIEGIGIELEVDECPSTESSPQKSEDMNNSSLFSSEKEFPADYLTNNTRKNDNCVETSPHPVAKSTPEPVTPKTSSCLIPHENPEFASLVKRMLNEKNLGRCSNEIAEAVEIEINASLTSRSLSPEPSLSSSLNNTVDKETDASGKLDDTGVEKDHSEKDLDPVVESAPSQIRHEKEKELEIDIVSLMGSPPPSSPPVENLAQVQDDANQYSLIDTTETSPKPHQSHQSVNKSQRTDINEENLSVSIMSSNCVESESKPSKSNEKIDVEDSTLEYKLLDVTVLVPRLKINRNRPLSAKYYARRQSRVILKPVEEFLNSVRNSKFKLRRTYRCLVCGEIFLKMKCLRTHLKEEHAGDERTFTCSLCGHVCQTKSTLMTHRKSRHELLFTDFVECKICEKKIVYDTVEALNMHILETHPFTEPYYVRCPHGEGECVWYLETVEDFREHVEIHHRNEDLSVPLDKIFPGELPWQCSLCRKVYSCDEYLSEHLTKTHGQ